MTTYEQGLERFDRLMAYGGVVRGKWQGVDAQGREVACWLGALDAKLLGVDYGICRAHLIPGWLAALIPLFDDNTSDEAWASLLQRYRAMLASLPRLTEAGSRRAMLKTMDAALAVAEPNDANGVVAPVRGLIVRELSGDPPTKDEWAAAEPWAGRVAAWAGAADSLGKRAAAWAAGWAAAEAEAETATKAASAAATATAWDRIATACFDAIEAETAT